MNMTLQYFTVKKITRFGVYEKFLRTYRYLKYQKENINVALLYPETAGHVISTIIYCKLRTKVSGHSRVYTLKQTESSKN